MTARQQTRFSCSPTRRDDSLVLLFLACKSCVSNAGVCRRVVGSAMGLVPRAWHDSTACPGTEPWPGRQDVTER